MPRRVRVVPGRGSSLFGMIAGFVMLLVLLGTAGTAAGPILLIPLAGIGISAYNAFGRGIATYEAELPDDVIAPRATGYCPSCGGGVGGADRFCRSCGSAL